MNCGDGLLFASGAAFVGTLWYMRQAQHAGVGMATECSARLASTTDAVSARAATVQSDDETSLPPGLWESDQTMTSEDAAKFSVSVPKDGQSAKVMRAKQDVLHSAIEPTHAKVTGSVTLRPGRCPEPVAKPKVSSCAMFNITPAMEENITD